MNARAHVLVVIAAVIVIVVLLRLVRAQHLRSKYALLWLTIAVLLVPVAVVPGLSNTLAEWLGVSTGRALFTLAALGFLFLVAVHFSWELSRLEQRTRILAEELALLRAEDPAGGTGGSEAGAPDLSG